MLAEEHIHLACGARENKTARETTRMRGAHVAGGSLMTVGTAALPCPILELSLQSQFQLLYHPWAPFRPRAAGISAATKSCPDMEINASLFMISENVLNPDAAEEMECDV